MFTKEGGSWCPSQAKAQGSRRTKAYIQYVEAACEEQRSIGQFMPATCSQDGNGARRASKQKTRRWRVFVQRSARRKKPPKQSMIATQGAYAAAQGTQAHKSPTAYLLLRGERTPRQRSITPFMPARSNEVLNSLRPRLARKTEIVADEAEGDARADGVDTYSEVSARPDNEVSGDLRL